MKTVVIMPGGFHPFHAGHYALYQQAKQAFPNAEVFVAATDDTSERPFPFAVKEKLSRLAGVEPGHFVKVKSPFRATEITSKFDPETDRLIFVRSQKDANKPPQAGGVKKDGSLAYLQPLADTTDTEPMKRHAYMAYLPTVEFGPGMTSATEIRQAWPKLDDRRKQALVMSLYPSTKGNTRLVATVIKMLDLAIMGMAEGLPVQPVGPVVPRNPTQQQQQQPVYAPPLNRKPPSPAAIIHITPTKEDQDYVEEKWSQKYKSSINCASPKGFSQRAHCAGRKKNEDVAEGDKTKFLDSGTVRRIQNFLNKKYDANLDVDGVMGPLTIQSIKKFIPNSQKKLAPRPDLNTKVQGKQTKSPQQIDEKCWDTHRQVGMKKKGNRMVPDCIPK